MRVEDFIKEEMNDKQIKKSLKKINAGKFKPLNDALWKDEDAIRAAGLDVSAMKSRYKEYMKLYNDLMKYTSKEYTDSSKHEEGLQKAAEIKNKLKSLSKENKSFEDKIRKGTVKYASNKNKKEAKATVVKSKMNKREKREAFIKNVRSKLKNPGMEIYKQFKKE